MKLEVSAAAVDYHSLELLARAYGIEARVDLAPVGASTDRSCTTFTSGGAIVEASFAPNKDSGMADSIEALYAAGDEPAALRNNDDALSGKRVVIVTNRPTHYRVPLFNRLARRLAACGGSLCVLFTSDLAAKPWMQPETMLFEHVGLTKRASWSGLPDIPVDLERRLRQLRPTVLLAGSLSPAIGGRVAHYAHGRQIPFGVWSGEISPSPTSVGRLRRLQRQWILRRCSYAISYGYRAGEYLRSVAPALPVVYGRNTTAFETPPDRSQRAGPVHLLAVSQAIPRKRLDLAIDAVAQLAGGACRLTVIGTGSCLEALRARARGHENIDVLGLVGSDRILDACRDADVFLFPSAFDPFGLVLVEALGCGLATVVSADPGAVGDLAVDGRNCTVVDDPTPARWAAAVSELVERPALRTALGAAGHATIRRRWTLDHAADAMAAGLRLGILASAGAHGQRSQPSQKTTRATLNNLLYERDLRTMTQPSEHDVSPRKDP